MLRCFTFVCVVSFCFISSTPSTCQRTADGNQPVAKIYHVCSSFYCSLNVSVLFLINKCSKWQNQSLKRSFCDVVSEKRTNKNLQMSKNREIKKKLLTIKLNFQIFEMFPFLWPEPEPEPQFYSRKRLQHHGGILTLFLLKLWRNVRPSDGRISGSDSHWRFLLVNWKTGSG